MGIIAKYKFDSSIYADLIPEFNAEFTSDLYTITDEVDSENSNHIIRTIESESLPTRIDFGVGGTTEQYTNRSDSLLAIYNLDTSAITDGNRMFKGCRYTTEINTSDWDTSNMVDMSEMFGYCINLTSLDVSNFNTSNVTSMYYMFYKCNNLTTLDVSNFDTSKVTGIYHIFSYCNNLITLDLSNWDTSNVTNMYAMFYNCSSLTSLDLSNFDTSNINVSNMDGTFANTPLTDIGMIYCDQDTINKVASLLPTDHNITIWVESDDILQYDQYDHITYKTQKVQDTVHLNSPLLKGDTIEVIDDKTYHVHRYEKVVLDGSEAWACYANGDITSVFYLETLKGKVEEGINLYCDKFFSRFSSWNVDTGHEGIQIDADIALVIQIDNSKLSTQDLNGFKQWLQANPTTVIYELATPYYELISEEPLELTLLDTTDNIINNNSILPSNMTIANKELSTIAIKPSTTYTLSFDKSNEDSEVTIDICGGEQITTVLNKVELTTPSELGSGIRFISSDGCIISNVRLLEGSLVESAIPKETFEGLQSSFEEGYIIGENLIKDLTPIWHSTYTHMCYYQIVNIKENTNYTLINPKIYDDTYFHVYGVTIENGNSSLLGYQSNKDEPYIRTFNTKTNTSIRVYCRLKYMDDLTLVNTPIEVNLDNNWNDLVLLEGDHTHLSEAELMRYIEKGISHYEEEDYNHVGKYKVEYKVTGKNKVNNDTLVLGTIQGNGVHQYFDKGVYCSQYIPIDITKQYTMSMTGFTVSETHYAVQYDKDKKYLGTLWGRGLNYVFSKECKYLRIGARKSNTDTIITEEELNNTLFQLEEGAVVTEYEPYKEDIRTYYLSSPFLKGDTIEDVNGVATHVKRYGKVVLDGSENWICDSYSPDEYGYYGTHKQLSKDAKLQGKMYSNNFKCYRENIDTQSKGEKLVSGLIDTYGVILILKANRLQSYNNDGINQWLSENPTTIVYELASPIYEPISTESILLDSYTNGHLDLSNENIPIQKTEFRNFTKELAYLQPSTDYIVRFSSDNIGIAKIYLDSSVKEINVVKGINDVIITTSSTIVNNNIIIDGIGFNISDVQVIANAIKDGDIKDFDYFKGLQSSFENGLVTDENDENYGKYKVECKITGKNKFDGELEYGRYNYIDGIKDENNSTSYMRCPKLIPIKNGSVRATVSGIDGDVWFVVYDTNGGYIDFGYAHNLSKFDGRIGYISFYAVQPSFTDNWYIQIEEGTQATSYEPYKESIHTLYLNSPLLKGDKLVVHDGKLYHYHKMGMVVLDGSKDINILDNSNANTSICSFKLDKIAPSYSVALCDNFIWIYNYNEDCKHFYVSSGNVLFILEKTKLSSLTVDGWKQWLQANPTTVVYKLKEPYYEPIEPQMSQYSFSTVKDGDMEIITILPIEKINLTYRTDINGVSSIEEQIASIQESTDISSIIDEEVDE